MIVKCERHVILYLLALFQRSTTFGFPFTDIRRCHRCGTRSYQYQCSRKITARYKTIRCRDDAAASFYVLHMGQPPNGDSETDTESIIDDGKVIVRGSEQDEFPEEFWQEIEAGKPSEWSVMKEVCTNI